ncbi:hypothetical protein OQA88_11438 [Cercophora sp. LCS_1]
MARVQSPPTHSQILPAATLRTVKDEIVGHVQQKETYVKNGILDSLVRVLQANRPPSIRNGDDSSEPRPLTESERVRLLALELIASFASGGPPFLPPLYAAHAIPAILRHISPVENPPQTVLTALRALSHITDAALLSPPSSPDIGFLAEELFDRSHIRSLNRILESNSPAIIVQDQKCLVASLISRLCRGAQHQNALADQGVLDSLATILASFVVLRGEVIPRAEELASEDGLQIPPPAPLGANLAVTLEAISAIIADSRYRTCMLMCSPAIMAVLPSIEFSPLVKEARAARNVLEISGLGGSSKSPGAADYLLPVVPIAQSKSYPSQVSRDASSSADDSDESESPLIPWLIYLVRSTNGLERVMAASVLASLFKAGFAAPEREVSIGLLVVPLLCRLIKDHDKPISAVAQSSAFVDPETLSSWAILERVPTVLARLVSDSECLQQSAFDCGAMKSVHKLLKDAYQPMSVRSPARPWSPNPERSDAEEGPPSCRVGPPGQLPIYAHRIRMRESALKLVASLVSQREEYRKAVADQDILPYIVESLAQSPSKPRTAKEKEKDKGEERNDPEYGINPNSVIIAACHAVRVLARSVGNLRTALHDNGVAIPIFKLLKHPVADVQLAASGSICNLVLECSPMRQESVLQVLCQHAHSEHPGLRLNAMWALKSLVNRSETALKRQALEELSPGWLVQLICDDTEDGALHIRMQPDEEMEVEATQETYPSDHLMPPIASPRVQRAKRKIAALREAEQDAVRKARMDDLAIQEQGINFIRNLISLPSAPGEMVDHIFVELGQERFFKILASKLSNRVFNPFPRKHATNSESRILPPQAKVVEAVVYVLVNIAASIPRHRQIIVAQTDLLKKLMTHITSRDADVRRALCHLLGNLGEREGDADNLQGDQRAQELRKLGFLSKLDELEKKDNDADVREQAKSAKTKISNAD